MQVVIVPVLDDNYSYLLVDTSTQTAAAVDPVEPDVVIAAAKNKGVQISTVLTTHSHWDHAGGNDAIKTKISNLVVVGGAKDDAQGVTHGVKHGDIVSVGNLKVHVLDTPCHTLGHVCYYVENPSHGKEGEEGKDTEKVASGVVFTGDTMFVGGCGNFNSGTPKQMAIAMLEVLGKLPGDTLVYVGHEYTLKNYAFGLFAEPDNKSLQTKMEWAQQKRKQNLPTVPTTIADEWATNPFMRLREPSIQAFTGEKDDAKGMYAVRKAKDDWGRRGKF